MFGIKTKIKRFIAHTIAATWKTAKTNTIEDLVFNKKYKVNIPTYEKSRQIVHPDILIRKQSPKFILAFTPYPNTNDKFENPCIVISDDGLNFYEEKEGINPLVPAPKKEHNDDQDLTFHNETYQLLYLETVRPDFQNLMLLTSKDRINWDKSILHSEAPVRMKDGFILSPALVYSKNECFMFGVNKDLKNGNSLFAIKGSELKDLDFSHNIELKLNGISKSFQPWHVDIFNDDKDGYVMLLSMVTPYTDRKKEYALFIATSKNLIDWNFQERPVLTNAYRSTGFVKDGVLYIYFSSNVYADVWKTGLFKTKF